jgi:hypothetical protein
MYCIRDKHELEQDPYEDGPSPPVDLDKVEIDMTVH